MMRILLSCAGLSSRAVLATLILAALLSPAGAAPMTLSGVVLGPDDKPIVGVTVEVAGAGAYKPLKREVTTDAAGRFSIEGESIPLPADEAVGAPAAPAKLSVGALVAAPGFGLASAVLKEGDNTIRLPKGTSVSGLIKNEQGQVAPGVAVRLRYITPEDPMQRNQGVVFLNDSPAITAMFTTQTGADGRWTLAGLPREGNATIELDDPRYVRLSQRISLGEAPAEAALMTAKPGTRITGRVIFEDAKPAAEIAVTVTGGSSYAQAKTGADGSYTLTGLPEGTYKVLAQDPKGEWVAPGLEGVTTRVAEATPAPDLTLGRGLVLKGQAVDAETKEPIKGISLGAQGAHGSTQSTPSDAQGNYTVRVVPGSVQLDLYNNPEGYINDRAGGTRFTATAAQKIIAPLQLKKGLTIQGTALDENGQPAVGATISIGSMFMGRQAPVDEKGAWSVKGINPAQERFGPPGREPSTLKLSTAGEWQIVKPATITLPVTAPVQVVLRRIQLATLEGRVVTPKGEAVPGALVKFKIALDPGSPSNSRTFRQKTTDTQGRYRLTHLRPEQEVSLTVEKEDFSFLRGGVVEKKDGVFRAEDVVLAPLQAQLAGRVLNAAGAPVADARVMVVGSKADAPARADAQGRFTLEKLPEGEATVMAASGRDFARITAMTGREAVVKLAPGQEPKSEDMARVAELITEWTREDDEGGQNAPGNRNGWRPEPARRMARLLAPHDPDLAVTLATGLDGIVEDSLMAIIIARLVRRDPRQAAAWAPARIEKMKPGYVRTAAAMNLALAVATADPALARRLMESEAATLKPTDFSAEAAGKYALLAAVAGKLNDPKANVWLDAFQAAAERSWAKDRFAGMIGLHAASVAAGSPALAEKLIDTLEPLEQISALERLVPEVARTDAEAARRLFARMEELMARPDLPVVEQKDDGRYRPTPQQSFDLVAEAVARALAPIDPHAALEVARKIKGDNRPWLRPIAMALAARQLKGETAAKAFREAVAAAGTEYWGGGDTIARIAAMAYENDPKLGEELFLAARRSLTNRNSPGEDEEMRPSYATYAFYRAPIDAAESRLLLEEEWTRRKAAQERAKKDPTANRYSNAGWQLGRLAQAMTAVDVDRALEMVGEIEGVEGGRNDVRPLIIAYLMASTTDRRTMAFDEYIRDDLR